jgi:hypothetical protein
MVTSSLTRFTLALVLAFGPLSMSSAEAADVASREYGRWKTLTLGSVSTAMTINESGHGLAMRCEHTNACDWRLILTTKCTVGDRYPVLANTNRGVEPLELLCSGELEPGYWVVHFADFDAATAVIMGDREHPTLTGLVGFAIALRDGQFRVVRFELIGMLDALGDLRARLGSAEKHAPQAPKITKDTLL